MVKSAQQWIEKKNRQKRVERYKVFNQYAKAIKAEGAQPQWQRSKEPADEAAAGQDGGAPVHRAKRRKGPVQAAQRVSEQKRQETEAEREEAERLAAERVRQRGEAKRRREETRSKHLARTKRGQPVLGNKVERMLAQLQQA